MNGNPFDEITARLDALAVDVRSLKARTIEKPNRKRRVGLTEAAQYCGWAERTMYKKCHYRQIPHAKVGGRLYFDLDQLDEWIDNGRRPMASEIAQEVMEGNKRAGKH